MFLVNYVGKNTLVWQHSMTKFWCRFTPPTQFSNTIHKTFHNLFHNSVIYAYDCNCILGTYLLSSKYFTHSGFSNNCLPLLISSFMMARLFSNWCNDFSCLSINSSTFSIQLGAMSLVELSMIPSKNSMWGFNSSP